MDTKPDEINTENNLFNANDTHLKEYTDEDDLKATVYVLLLFSFCVFNGNTFSYNQFQYLIFRGTNLTINSQLYNAIEINQSNLTNVGNKILESSILNCHEASIQQTEEVSFDEKEKKTSNGYAETSLDEATNYSLLCEDDDNGEKALTGDTTQTYCTEGTPYNFSNAASYTDLRKCGLEDKVIQFTGLETSYILHQK